MGITRPSRAGLTQTLKETGCKVRVAPDMLAKTLEYRGTLKQESHAYICKVLEDTGKPQLTEVEASEVCIIP